MIHEPAAALAVIVMVGVVCQMVAEHWRIPSIILLLTAGLTMGPGLDVIDPDALFGDLLFPAVSAAVALLLFEGGLSLRWREVGGVRVVLLRLLTVGVVTAAAVGAAAAYLIGGLPVGPALLFGVIMVVTGPTVVIPLLRHTRLRPDVARLLRWEGIFVDPVGAVLAVVVFEVLVVDEDGRLAEALGAIAVTAIAGAAVGGIAAFALTFVLRTANVPDHLENAVAFATVMGAFATANAIFDEAGLVAATVLGFVLASQRRVPMRGIAEFHESIAVLLVPLMFILLAARVSSADLARNLLPAAGVTAALVLVSRPLSVWISTIGSAVTPTARRYVAAMAPRGIVAASVSALFGLRLEERGVGGGPDLAAMTFLVVAGTVVIYGLAAMPLARRLHVAAADPTGLILVGSPPWAVSLAETLVDQGVPVLIIAGDEEDGAAAAERGLLVYTGRLQSDELEEAVAAIGARLALVVSHREEVAAFAADRLGRIVGQSNLFVVPASHQDHEARTARPAEHWGRIAFGGRLTVEEAAERVASGARFSALPAGTPLLPTGASGLVLVSAAGVPSIVEDDDVPADAAGTIVVLAGAAPVAGPPAVVPGDGGPSSRPALTS